MMCHRQRRKLQFNSFIEAEYIIHFFSQRAATTITRQIRNVNKRYQARRWYRATNRRHTARRLGNLLNIMLKETISNSDRVRVKHAIIAQHDRQMNTQTTYHKVP